MTSLPLPLPNPSVVQFCVECEEKYCEGCYVKFHRKGALTKHHAQPLGSNQGSTIREVTVASNKPTHSVKEEQRGGEEHAASGMGGSGSLLEGTFNEDETGIHIERIFKDDKFWNDCVIT